MGWIWHLCLMNMKRRKIRTFLTVLGVMIGVISVVALLAVGIGVKNEMIDSAVASGSVNQITIYSETRSKHKDRMITDRTISTLTDLANVDGCYPLYEVPVSMNTLAILWVCREMSLMAGVWPMGKTAILHMGHLN